MKNIKLLKQEKMYKEKDRKGVAPCIQREKDYQNKIFDEKTLLRINIIIDQVKDKEGLTKILFNMKLI